MKSSLNKEEIDKISTDIANNLRVSIDTTVISDIIRFRTTVQPLKWSVDEQGVYHASDFNGAIRYSLDQRPTLTWFAQITQAMRTFDTPEFQISEHETLRQAQENCEEYRRGLILPLIIFNG